MLYSLSLKRRRPTQWQDESDRRTYYHMYRLESEQIQLYTDIVFAKQLMTDHRQKFAGKHGLRHVCDFNNHRSIMQGKRWQYQALNSAMSIYHFQGPALKRPRLY